MTEVVSGQTDAGAGSVAEIGINPFAPGYFEDPYAQYRALRRTAPVHHSPMGPWTITRYEDCSRLLRDPTLSVAERNATAMPRSAVLEAAGYERSERGSRSILNLDPPDHTRIRRLAQQAFTPRRVEALVPRVQALVDGMLDRVEPDGAMDVIADLAFPLPFAVISEMLGMPEHDRDELRAWSHTVVKSLEPIVVPEELAVIIDAGDHLSEHIQAAIEWKRREPADDLLSALIAAEEEGDRLSPAELQDQVALLYVAGHETTVNLIGNGTLALLRHPDQLARLRADPTLIGNAVEELLRYDSPVQFSRRIALQDLELGGQHIEAHTFVMTCLGAANRDPEHFGPTAEQLDLQRREAPHHISFGGGIHHCLGAVLARTEARVAIGTLVRRCPGLSLATDEPPWNGRMILRGVDALPVRL
ncbi:MAG TPA: cytochrome P450 [Acidimicrobiia bacterium]|jgi:cytochrome P450|nr:cytochrome P450 [Acidimicrobiia bacterium]HEV3451087.1 cytochrome P450 [Acidimicrobiia bacterium]